MTPFDSVRGSTPQGLAGSRDGLSDRRAKQQRDSRSLASLWVGVLLVALCALGGLYFAVRPVVGRPDQWLGDLMPRSHSRWFTEITSLRYPVVITLGAVVLAAICFPRDRARSLACLVGPPLALAACELVAKPLVGRTLGGSLSYPSGSTVGAAALATALVLATPPGWRVVSTIVASAYTLWVALAVVSLQWHYPTDALAGVAFGVGVVLMADGLSMLLFGPRWRGQGTSSARHRARGASTGQ